VFVANNAAVAEALALDPAGQGVDGAYLPIIGSWLTQRRWMRRSYRIALDADPERLCCERFRQPWLVFTVGAAGQGQCGWTMGTEEVAGKARL